MSVNFLIPTTHVLLSLRRGEGGDGDGDGGNGRKFIEDLDILKKG